MKRRRPILLAVGAVVVAIPATATVGAGVPRQAGATPAWQRDATPTSGPTNSNALSTNGPGDVWAVGSDYTPTGKGRSLIEHWNGASWIRSAPVPDEAADDSLNAVSTDGPNDGWAVGSTFSPSAGYQPLVAHFDGNTWAAQSFASPSNQFTAVTALSPDDVWVLGNVPGYGSSGLIEHFDGKGGKAVAQPASVRKA